MAIEEVYRLTGEVDDKVSWTSAFAVIRRLLRPRLLFAENTST